MKIYVLLLLLFLSITCEGQQLPLFTQYREYLGVINPAAVSSDFMIFNHNFSSSISHRLQWASFEGAPQTSLIKGEYIYDTENSVSLLTGGYIINDKIGPTGNSGIYGRVGGILSPGKNAHESGIILGLTAGMAQFRIRSSNLELVDPTDDLTKNNQSKFYPDVGAGVFIYHRIQHGVFRDDNFYAGVSVPQLFGLDLTFTNDNGSYTVTKVPHFFGLIGFNKFLGESFVEPSLWVRYVEGIPLQIDGNFRLSWKRSFWVGFGLSTGGNAHIEAGFIIGEEYGDRNLKIGAGYDHSFSTFGPFAGATYEINISYSFETK